MYDAAFIYLQRHSHNFAEVSMLWTYFWLAANEGLKKKMEANSLFVDF